MFPPSALVPLVLSKLLAEDVKRSTQTFDSGGTMLDGGSLAHCGFLSRPHAQGFAISAFNPLAAQRYVLHRQGFSSQSVKQWWGQLKHLCQRSTSSAGRNGQVGVLERVFKTVPYLPLN